MCKITEFRKTMFIIEKRLDYYKEIMSHRTKNRLITEQETIYNKI